MTTATRQPASKTAIIKGNNWDDTYEGDEVKAEVGSYVKLDGGRMGEKLAAGDDFVDEDFPGCDFRYPSPVQAWVGLHDIACNVHVTGRTYQYDGGSRRVRVSVEWVGDCEPSTFTSGWLYV